MYMYQRYSNRQHWKSIRLRAKILATPHLLKRFTRFAWCPDLFKCQQSKFKISVNVSHYQLSKYLMTLVVDWAWGCERTKFVFDDHFKTFLPGAENQSFSRETWCCIELETRMNNPCSDPINHSNRDRIAVVRRHCLLIHKLHSTMSFICANQTLISKWFQI